MTCKNLNQWTEYLSAMPERADTDHPGKTLPAKGPAIAIPSEHVEHLLSLIDALCYKYHACTFEQQQLADGIKAQVGALRSSTEIVCP